MIGISAWGQALGEPDCPYIKRWVLELGPFGSLRLHKWIKSDWGPLHDHQASFWTLVLKGGYTDRGEDRDERLKAPTLRLRKATHKHTVVVDEGGCWTLCWFLPDKQEWGFFVDGVKITANKYFFGHNPPPCD